MKGLFFITLLVSVLMSAAAHAEHKLLVTDVLDPGETEVAASLSYRYLQYSVKDKNEGDELVFKVKKNATSATVGAAVGLPAGFQLSISAPYYFVRKRTFSSIGDGATIEEYNEGLGDVTAGIRYRISDGKRGRLGLAVGASIKPETANGQAGEHKTWVTVTAGVNGNFDRTRPFFAYSGTLVNHDGPDMHSFFGGVETEITPDVVATLTVRGTAFTATNQRGAAAEYSVDFSGAFQLMKNFYLQVGLKPYAYSGADLRNSSLKEDPGIGIETRLGIYRLF